MSTHKETRLVHCYDPVAFVIAVEQGVKDGFSLDLVTPAHYPVVLGYQYICTMVKDEQQEVKNSQKEVLTIKVDASEVQAVVDKVVEEVKTLVEAHEAQQTTEGTEKQSDVVVEAPKKAGRPAKGK